VREKDEKLDLNCEKSRAKGITFQIAKSVAAHLVQAVWRVILQTSISAAC
jgi:hypothetical protein